MVDKLNVIQKYALQTNTFNMCGRENDGSDIPDVPYINI
jgi:hypothetical protein